MSAIGTPREKRVRSVLLEAWDPAGIGDNPHLYNEYDEFIPRLIAAIEVGAGTFELIALLRDFEAEMRAPINDDARRRAAEALVSLG